MAEREEPWPLIPGDPGTGVGTGFGPEPLSDVVARAA